MTPEEFQFKIKVGVESLIRKLRRSPVRGKTIDIPEKTIAVMPEELRAQTRRQKQKNEGWWNIPPPSEY